MKKGLEMPTLTLDKNNYPLVVGNKDKLTFEDWENSGSSVIITAQINRAMYCDKDIMWSVENPEIVSLVWAQGLQCEVRGRTTGYTKVWAKLPDGSGASCYLTVIDNITRTTVGSLRLNTELLHMELGATTTLVPLLLPVDVWADTVSGEDYHMLAKTMNTDLEWFSTDESVVCVEDGKVRALTVGDADIIAVSKDVGRKACCHVVVQEDIGVIGMEAVTPLELELIEGETDKLTAKCIFKENSMSRVKGQDTIRYVSAYPFVANVDQEGTLTAYSNSNRQCITEDHLNVTEIPRSIEVLATSIYGGFITKFQVQVNKGLIRATTLLLSDKRMNLVVGMQKEITAIVGPSNVLIEDVEFISSDPTIVEIVKSDRTVDGHSKVNLLGKCEGEAIITATSNGLYAECRITVCAQPQFIEKIVIPKEISLDVDQVFRVLAEYNSNVTTPELIWISSNQNLVSLSQPACLQGYHPGIATIYVFAIDNVTDGQQEALKMLQNTRNIEEDKSTKQILMNLCKQLPHAVSKVTIKNSSVYLRNLHAPKEAITDSSVSLLWNRASMVYAKELDYYEIFCNGGKIAETTKLSYTVKGLDCHAEYEFGIKVLNRKGEVLAEDTIKVMTCSESPVLNVCEAPFYAKGDGSVLDTLAIQSAIDSCPKGGTVYLPAEHIFCTGALFLKSDMNLQVDGILKGSSDPKDYPWVISRWEGFRRLPEAKEEWANSTQAQPYNTYVRASLLNVGVYDEGVPGSYGPFNIENVVIRGSGQINGDGFRLGYNEGCNQHNAGGGKPVPFSPIMNQTLRGSILRMHNAKNVYVADLTLAYGPGWQVHPIYCMDITFDNVKLISKGNGVTGAADDIGILNGDGIDPDSCAHVNIVNCFFFCNDDSVTLKSGRNREGNELRKPTAYIRVTDCVSDNSKAAYVAGSEIASGCHDVLMQNLIAKDAMIGGLWIKTMAPRGGKNFNLQYRDITIEGCGMPIRMALEYTSIATSAASVNPALELPDIGWIDFENVRDLGGNIRGMQFVGLENQLIHDIRFEQVEFFKSGKEHLFEFCRDFAFIDCDLGNNEK